MKRLLLFVCIAWLFQVGLHVKLTNAPKSEFHFLHAEGEARKNLSPGNLSVLYVTQYAWQAAPRAMPIEERNHFNWWWWVIGVVLVLGGGVLLYFLIKKDPKHDVR